MFSLIITIISIALVAALALATLYYGGDAFQQGKAGADASRLINEGQQINAAVTLADATGLTPADLGDLVPAVLSQLPASFASADSTLITAGMVTNTADATADVCAEVQKRAGVSAGTSLADAATAGTSSQLFGCYLDGANHVFFYKF